VIHLVHKRQWEDVNWDGEQHRTCINTELGTFCRLLYTSMVTAGGQPTTDCTHVGPLGTEAIR
jgi:hypothetical protein